jgi:hypothetical protein
VPDHGQASSAANTPPPSLDLWRVAHEAIERGEEGRPEVTESGNLNFPRLGITLSLIPTVADDQAAVQMCVVSTPSEPVICDGGCGLAACPKASPTARRSR